MDETSSAFKLHAAHTQATPASLRARPSFGQPLRLRRDNTATMEAEPSPDLNVDGTASAFTPLSWRLEKIASAGESSINQEEEATLLVQQEKRRKIEDNTPQDCIECQKLKMDLEKVFGELEVIQSENIDLCEKVIILESKYNDLSRRLAAKAADVSQRDRELQQLKNQLKESKLESATRNSADKAASAALEEASRKQAEECVSEIRTLREKVRSLLENAEEKDKCLRKSEAERVRAESERDLLNEQLKTSQTIANVSSGDPQEREKREWREEVQSLQEKLDKERLRSGELLEANRKLNAALEEAHRRRQRVEKMESENAFLQHRKTNMEALRMEIESLQRRLREAEEEVLQQNSIKMELEQLRQEKERWESMLGSVESFVSPAHVTRSIRHMQGQTAELEKSLLERDARIATIQRNASKTTSSLEACKRQLQEARERERKTAEALMRADKWKKSLEEERDRLKLLINSYNNEDPTSLFADRITSLEQSIQEKTEKVEELEGKLREREQDGTSSEVVKQLSALQMEQQRLQLENQQHLNTINTLYERIGPGEFDASKVKVLHAVNNPTSDYLREQVTSLRSENAALHAKLSRLQETSENTPSTQKQAHESGASTSELQHLEREIASLRKERDELTEAKAKIGEICKRKVYDMRVFITKLFGWIVAYNTRERTYSVSFLRNQEQQLQFQKKGDELNMLATDFAASERVKRIATQPGMTHVRMIALLTLELSK